MKLTEYLEKTMDLASPVDPNTGEPTQQIQVYVGSKDQGQAVPGAAVKFAGSTTGAKKDVKVGDKPAIIYYLTDAAAKQLLDVVAAKFNLQKGVVDDFIKANSPIPFTNGVVELDVKNNQITLLGDIAKLK